MTEKVENVEEAVNEFYKLKNKYESDIKKNKKQIIGNNALSKKEKMIEYLKLKPKCINCKRPGGTKFSVTGISATDKEEAYRELKAVCQVLPDPCNLNITIKLGQVEILSSILDEIEGSIKSHKDQIIKDKNDLLFGYINSEDALSSFDVNKEYVSEFTSLLEEHLNLYNEIVDNPERNDELKREIENSFEYVEQIKNAIKTYDEDNDLQYVKDAVNIYITSLKPTLSKILHLKYRQNEVFYDEDTGTYQLIQRNYTTVNLEFNSFKNNVASYDVGLKSGKFGQQKQTIIEKKPLIIESSDSENESTPQPESAKPIETFKPETIRPKEDYNVYPVYVRKVPIKDIKYTLTTDANGNTDITWNNEDYNMLWKNLPFKIKNMLSEDANWATKFMNNCLIFTGKNGSTQCSFVAPDNLIVPPEKLDNDKYDFGVKAYNEMFNELNPELQESLLSKITTSKDGSIDTKIFISAINSILAKKVNFANGYFNARS